MKFLLRFFSKKRIFFLLFSPEERTAILNALWKRSNESSYKIGYGEDLKNAEEKLQSTCSDIAKELMS